MSTGQIIGKNSRITIGVALGVIALIGPGVWECAILSGQISQLNHNQWTIGDMKSWAMEFQKNNPGVDVPLPKLEDSKDSSASKTNKIIMTSRSQ